MPEPLYRLPLQRQPISPYRFSSPIRALFRQELAKSARIRTDQILIRRVYDRFPAGVFESVKTDEHGILSATPASHTVGQRSQKEGLLPSHNPGHLIIGQRLDTRQQVMALVTAEDIAAVLRRSASDPPPPAGTIIGAS